MFAYLLVLPALLFTFAFSFYPVFYEIFISFHSVNLVNIGRYVGLLNFKLILTSSRSGADLINSFVFTFGSMAGTMFFGIVFAVVLNENVRMRTFFRSALLIPWVVTQIVSMTLFKWMINYHGGLLNVLLDGLGLQSVDLLGSTGTAMLTVVAANVWRATAYTMILVLAGIQTIPGSVFESSILDGAGFWRRTLQIVVPLIKAPLLVIIVTTTISYFNRVIPILVLTGGGPLVSTETLGVRMYLEAFSNLHMSFAAAFGVIIFLINLALMIIYIRVIRLEHYY